MVIILNIVSIDPVFKISYLLSRILFILSKCYHSFFLFIQNIWPIIILLDVIKYFKWLAGIFYKLVNTEQLLQFSHYKIILLVLHVLVFCLHVCKCAMCVQVLKVTRGGSVHKGNIFYASGLGSTKTENKINQ